MVRTRRECQAAFDAGCQEMVALAADAARTHDFDEKTLRLALAEIAHRSYGDGATVNEVLEAGWKQGEQRENHAAAKKAGGDPAFPKPAAGGTEWES